MCTRASSCCSNTPFESLPRCFSRKAVLSWSSKVCIGHSSYCNAFCVPKYCSHQLVNRWLCLELLWPRGPRPYPLTTLSFILYLIIMNLSLIYRHQTQKKIIFWPKKLQQSILLFWLPFAHRQGIWGPNGQLACAYLSDHVRLLKRYHVKCLIPALFLSPEFAYQSIPDPEQGMKTWPSRSIWNGIDSPLYTSREYLRKRRI